MARRGKVVRMEVMIRRNRKLVDMLRLVRRMVSGSCLMVLTMGRMGSRERVWVLRLQLRARLFLLTGRPLMVWLLVAGKHLRNSMASSMYDSKPTAMCKEGTPRSDRATALEHAGMKA
jgi:hypothetical protein